jgi:hypothetical protein
MCIRCMALLIPLALASCADHCSNRVVSKTLSPNGQLEAVLFSRNCGATSGFSSQVSIVEAGDLPIDGGNVFVADTGHGLAHAGSWGGPLVKIDWQTDRQILISYAAQSLLFLNNEEVDA